MIISGEVVRGRGKGKRLGFPTVNLKLENSMKVKSGVYAGTVEVDDEKYKAGIFVSRDKKRLEAHILDFDGDLLNKEIGVEIGEKIREVMKFDNDKDLVEQIKEDVGVISRCHPELNSGSNYLPAGRQGFRIPRSKASLTTEQASPE